MFGPSMSHCILDLFPLSTINHISYLEEEAGHGCWDYHQCSESERMSIYLHEAWSVCSVKMKLNTKTDNSEGSLVTQDKRDVNIFQ